MSAPPRAEKSPVATPAAAANAARWNGRVPRDETLSGSENDASPWPASSTPQRTASSASGQSRSSRGKSQMTGETLRPKQHATSTGRAPTLSRALPHNGAVSMRTAAMAPL